MQDYLQWMRLERRPETKKHDDFKVKLSLKYCLLLAFNWLDNERNLFKVAENRKYKDIDGINYVFHPSGVNQNILNMNYDLETCKDGNGNLNSFV